MRPPRPTRSEKAYWSASCRISDRKRRMAASTMASTRCWNSDTSNCASGTLKTDGVCTACWMVVGEPSVVIPVSISRSSAGRGRRREESSAGERWEGKEEDKCICRLAVANGGLPIESTEWWEPAGVRWPGKSSLGTGTWGESQATNN